MLKIREQMATMPEGEEIVVEAPPGIDKARADKVLHSLCPEFSRTRLQAMFDAGLVWLDDEAIGKNHKISAGAKITFTPPAAAPSELRAVDIPLDILYEDDHIIAINKPSGMVTHPGNATGEDTLAHALLFHCGEKLNGVGGSLRPGIVHRLDKETSGVMVAAKSDAAYMELSRSFAERKIDKEYLALVVGKPKLRSGTIDEPIGRHPVHRVKMAVNPRGRAARTDWEIVEAFGESFSLLGLKIHTGRTHQIRVHLAHIGHPVVGDPVYGKKAKTDSIEAKRTMLHARRLGFQHPVEKRPIILEADLPDDFLALRAEFAEKFRGQSEA